MNCKTGFMPTITIGINVLKNLWNKLRDLFPPAEEDWIAYVRTRDGGLKLEYSSEEYFYKHFKRQFDAARELHDMLKQKEGSATDASKEGRGP